MKAFRILTTTLSLGIILAAAGCGGSKGSTETTQDKQLGILTGTWKVSTVFLGGVDQSSTWPAGGFQLTLSGTKGATSFTYSCAGRPALSPWPASGVWSFGTDPVTQIVRDPGTADVLPVSYAATSTSLQVSFTYTGNGYTRVDNVAGSWVFTFTK